MTSRHATGVLVLAIFPTFRGFGYVVFEGVHTLLDWGVKEVRHDKNRQNLAKVRQLMDWYSPDAVVVHDCSGSRHSQRVKKLARSILRLADRQHMEARKYTRVQIRAAFSGIDARSKYRIAQAIVGQCPELELWLPRPRKLWESEDVRMSIFDAAALAYTYFHADGREPMSARHTSS